MSNHESGNDSRVFRRGIGSIVEGSGIAADVVAMHYSVRLLMVILGAIVVGWLVWKQMKHLERRPKTIAVVALVVVALGLLEYRAQAAEGRYGKVASELAHRHVSVRCQGMFGHLIDIGQELGTVQFNADGDPANKTDIKRDACNWLKEYEKGDKKTTLDGALAVHVLAHEAMHLRGWTSESVAECYGLQYTAQVARDLGATSRQAQSLAEFYWRVVYPEMPDEYRTEECVDGGRLDLHKDSTIWP